MPRPLLSTLTFIVFNISFVYAQGLDSIYIQPQEYELETFNFSSTLISDPEIDEFLYDYVIYDVDFSDINDALHHDYYDLHQLLYTLHHFEQEYDLEILMYHYAKVLA